MMAEGMREAMATANILLDNLKMTLRTIRKLLQKNCYFIPLL